MSLRRASATAPAGSAALPAAAVVGSIVSLSVGTSYAERLFPVVGFTDGQEVSMRPSTASASTSSQGA